MSNNNSKTTKKFKISDKTKSKFDKISYIFIIGVIGLTILFFIFKFVKECLLIF